MTIETAKKLLENNKRLYDQIAREFAQTREGKFDELIPLGQYAEEGDRILDAGSGSGRLFNIFKNRGVQYFGIDVSGELTQIAKEKWKSYSGANFQVGDLLAIPFPNAYFDTIYSIAAFHHVPSRELRLKALAEIYRVLKPGRKFIMMNWYFWRGPAIFIILKYWLKSFFYSFLQHSHILKNVKMFADLDFGDIFVPWGKKGLRYYHSFRKHELEKLLKDAGFKSIKQIVRRGAEAINSDAALFTSADRKSSARRIGADYWSKRVNLVTIAQK